ncbi:universal stress protein [Mycolicibacterium lacusdiani]|uniref:universal stress protein n=1 Tax=Mycolicibacterium lacusdiani TaxID=2895283 RepID=UPI001F16DE34|nr:universal stress protein [Mycolicibacterium lacusdiani]
MTTQAAIVVGIDGSDSAKLAARWAGAVADRMGATLRLVHAMPNVGINLTEAAALYRVAAMTYHSENADRLLKEASEAVFAAHPGLDVDVVASREPVDEALLRASESARLVVLGSVDVSPAGVMLLGSTTLAVTVGSHCPVIAWRGAGDAPTSAPIVVGLDETPSAVAALNAALDLATYVGAPVRVVHSWTFASYPREIDGFPDWEELNAATRRRIEALVEQASKAHPGPTVSVVWEPAGASHALLDHLDDAQLVAVGNRGRSALTAAVMGSTSLNLLHHSRIPVMVCRDPTARI